MSASSLVLSSLLFKLLAFLRKWTSFIDQKCTCEKVTKNLVRALSPPPSFGQSKRTATFFVKPSLRQAELFQERMLMQDL